MGFKVAEEPCQTGSGGEGGIRTPGPLRANGFQDRRNRPLCHFSGTANNTAFQGFLTIPYAIPRCLVAEIFILQWEIYDFFTNQGDRIL